MITVVVCESHTTPLPVARFFRDEAGEWRQAGDSAHAVAVRGRITLRCRWCRYAVVMSGRSLAPRLAKRSLLTLLALRSKAQRRRESRGRVSRVS